SSSARRPSGLLGSAALRARLETLVGQLFPGMGLRPLWLTCVASLALTAYHYHGGGPSAPQWFVDFCAELLDIPHRRFHEHLWSHTTAVVLLMIAPLIACFALEGWTPRDLGFRIRGTGRETLIVLGLWVVMLPLVWLVHDTPSFAATYPRFPPAEHDARLFALYEGFYLVKWIAWEFFFRGFMLFGFGKDFLHRAVLVSTIPFVIMHFGKPEAETLGALVAGLVLCFLALRSKSIWPGVLLHWLVAGTIDFFASYWRR